MIAEVRMTITSSMFARMGQTNIPLVSTQRQYVSKMVTRYNQVSYNEVMEV